MPVVDALTGEGWTCTNNVLPKTQVVWGYDAATQKWHAYFPDYTDVPGANDLEQVERGLGYFVALKRQSDAPSRGRL
jgi:hypothetical protein